MPRKKPARVEPLSGQRQPRESDTAVMCCNDWLRLGVARSMPKLLAHYQESSKTVKDFTAPTASLASLGTWSSRYNWPSRAEAFDAAWEAQKELERKAVMSEGLALDYERVRELLGLAGFLKEQIYTKSDDGKFDRVWMPDVKSIGSGDNAERVDIERFNSALLEQYRATLNDIALEVGGRVRKSDVTSGGKTIPILITKMDVDEL